MTENQVIWPVSRILANPLVVSAIAEHLDGPDAETLLSAFYELLEMDLDEGAENDNEDDLGGFAAVEICFREDPDQPGIFQVILSTGQAMELKPQEGVYLSSAKDENDLNVMSAVYSRLVRAIEEADPVLEGDVALCEVPSESNGFLRAEDGDSFSGWFHKLSDPDKKFRYIVDVVDLPTDDLRARIVG